MLTTTMGRAVSKVVRFLNILLASMPTGSESERTKGWTGANFGWWMQDWREARDRDDPQLRL